MLPGNRLNLGNVGLHVFKLIARCVVIAVSNSPEAENHFHTACVSEATRQINPHPLLSPRFVQLASVLYFHQGFKGTYGIRGGISDSIVVLASYRQSPLPSVHRFFVLPVYHKLEHSRFSTTGKDLRGIFGSSLTLLNIALLVGNL